MWKRLAGHILELLGLIGAILILALGVILDLPEFQITWPLAIFLGFVFLQMVTTQVQLYRMRNTQPNVVAEQVNKEDVPTTFRVYNWLEPTGLASGTINMTTDAITHIHDPLVQYRSLGPNYERYYVSFRNTPAKGRNIRDAEDVHARVIFTNEKSLSHEKPRWVGKPLPNQRQENILIRANGRPEGLYLVLREQGGKSFYVFSDDSYSQDSFEPLKQNLKLEGKTHHIRIELNDKYGWREEYLLEMVIQDGEPTFSVVSLSEKRVRQ